MFAKMSVASDLPTLIRIVVHVIVFVVSVVDCPCYQMSYLDCCADEFGIDFN